MENNTATETKTLRSAARELVAESVYEAAALSHERNNHKLHVRRDGTVSWTESINRSDDLIDDRAEGFAAIPSVISVGTGSFACNCDHCNDVYNANDEALAKEEGREYGDKYATRADAIADAVSDGDHSYMEAAMLAAFDEIQAGYFDDESAYEVKIADYNSAGIRQIAAEIGATHMRRIAVGSLNGERGTLFALPCKGGEIRVLDTNADPVWEEEDAAAFAETLVEYGIDDEEAK